MNRYQGTIGGNHEKRQRRPRPLTKPNRQHQARWPSRKAGRRSTAGGERAATGRAVEDSSLYAERAVRRRAGRRWRAHGRRRRAPQPAREAVGAGERPAGQDQPPELRAAVRGRHDAHVGDPRALQVRGWLGLLGGRRGVEAEVADERAAVFVVWQINRDIFNMPSREPATAGVLDKRLGVSNKKDTCEVGPFSVVCALQTPLLLTEWRDVG